jgi:hypothetical protein
MAVGNQHSTIFDGLRRPMKRFVTITVELLNLWSEEWHREEPAFLGGKEFEPASSSRQVQGVEAQGVMLNATP